MKKAILLLGLIALTTLSLNASVWRVNSAPGSSAHYTSIQAAHDATTTLAGDTIYCEGSASGVGGLYCTKPLTIIGTGYFLSENPETQAVPLASYTDFIYFQTGSEGSKVSGMTIGYIYLYTSNIIITRNKINMTSYGISGQAYNLTNIIIAQNYVGAGYYYNYAIYFPYDATNILITNNYIEGYLLSGTNFSSIVTNNVFYGYLQVYNSVIKNNILYGAGYFTNYNCVYTNNISYDASFGSADGNQSNVTMSTVFQLTGSSDGRWMLLPGSPALGAGENGVDCGMFGGAYPYVLSGMPDIPSIYYMDVPAIPSSTLDVAIKAKSHN